jgi:PAS domain-containing protein
VKEIQAKAALERKSLEEQLTKDILAAEERAETERTKIESRFAHEKAELEQAAVIARAEAESEWRGRVASLEDRLAKVPPLQGYVTHVHRDAFIAADAQGRIVAWSAGAAELDQRTDAEALGRRVHKDVLILEGVDWKKLFGKVVVSGRVEGDYTLLLGDSRKAVKLVATLVRGADGRILGVAESLRLLQPEASLELHGRAAFARVAAPLYKTLEDRALAGLAVHRRTATAAEELTQVAAAVVAGASTTELEALARDLDLAGLVEAAPKNIKDSDKAWLGMRVMLQDLTAITSGVAEGGTLQIRWNELVERCLSVVEAAPRGPRPAERVFGERHTAEVRGEFVVPLLLALFNSPTPKGQTPAVATSADADQVQLDSRGPAPSPETIVLLTALAKAAGAEMTFGHDGKAATASLALPRYPVVEATAIEGDDDADDLPELELELEALPDDADDPTSVGRLALPGIDDDPADDDSSSEAVLASGSVDLVEEDDGGDLLLMLGEDSAVLRKAPEVAYVPVSATGSHPRVDAGMLEGADAELEGAFEPEERVSASIRDAAEAMDAFAARQSKSDKSAPPASPTPSPEVLREMQATDSGPHDAEPTDKSSSSKKGKGKKKRKKKGSRNK